jgi:hypothetical protein
MNGPVILDHIHPLGLSIDLSHLLVESNDLLAPDNRGIQIGDLPGDSIEGPDNPLLAVVWPGTLRLGAGAGAASTQSGPASGQRK